MKDIIIIANFCRDFSESDNGRFMYLCKKLCTRHNVEIVTSDFSHSKKKPKSPLTVEWPFKITFLHEPGYKKNVSIQRFLSHKVWGKNVGKYLGSRIKPDVIYCAVPSLTAAREAAKYCKKNDVEFIIDIQDLWPEAFQMVFNIPLISDVLFIPFKWIANSIYRAADKIIGVSNTYVQRAISVSEKCKQGRTVYLGTEKKSFDKYISDEVLRNDALKIVYVGTLGNSYDLNTVIDAIALLDVEKKVELVVIGDGPQKEKFEKYAEEKGLCVNFIGRLAYSKMVSLLTQCDIAVNPIKKGSAASVINKACDYAMAGLPVVNTQESPEYRALLEQYNAGINCTCEDPVAVEKAFRQLIKDESLRRQMGKGSRRLGIEKFDRASTYQLIVNELNL